MRRRALQAPNQNDGRSDALLAYNDEGELGEFQPVGGVAERETEFAFLVAIARGGRQWPKPLLRHSTGHDPRRRSGRRLCRCSQGFHAQGQRVTTRMQYSRPMHARQWQRVFSSKGLAPFSRLRYETRISSAGSSSGADPANACAPIEYALLDLRSRAARVVLRSAARDLARAMVAFSVRRWGCLARTFRRRFLGHARRRLRLSSPGRWAGSAARRPFTR